MKESIKARAMLVGKAMLLPAMFAVTATIGAATTAHALNERWRRDVVEIRKVAPDSPIAAAIERELDDKIFREVNAAHLAPGFVEGDPVGLAALEKLALAKPAERVPEVAAVIREVRATGVLTRDQRLRLVKAVLDAPAQQVDPGAASAIAASFNATLPTGS